MTKPTTSDDRYKVYRHLMDNYSRHYLAQNLSLELPDSDIEYYLNEIEECKK